MFKQSTIELYDEYTSSRLPRRHFLEILALLAGGPTAPVALLPVLENNYAMAAQVVAEQNIWLTAGTNEILRPNGPIQAYVAKPKNA
ncbi:MAG: hypothetical protein P8O70_05730 [SAR324 cluster bacterium]|jgi:carboxymethylenebutenolidase|nr:hypothetical protein [SAR324 cluster bacterium]